jgi:hypothetical protein
VRTNNITLLIVALVLLTLPGIASCGDSRSYTETVNFIRTTMADYPSEYRKETYGPITFASCRLDYSVAGAYPVGDLYDIKFTGIDFSTLDPREAKTGNDYTPFIILSFKNHFTSRDGYQELKLRNLVINLSSEAKAAELYRAFLHLGALCSCQGRAVDHNL